jgi:hypothetical protein
MMPLDGVAVWMSQRWRKLLWMVSVDRCAAGVCGKVQLSYFLSLRRESELSKVCLRLLRFAVPSLRFGQRFHHHRVFIYAAILFRCRPRIWAVMISGWDKLPVRPQNSCFHMDSKPKMSWIFYSVFATFSKLVCPG